MRFMVSGLRVGLRVQGLGRTVSRNFKQVLLGGRVIEAYSKTPVWYWE
jgi:hypothetical protein